MLEERNIYPRLTDSCFGCYKATSIHTSYFLCFTQEAKEPGLAVQMVKYHGLCSYVPQLDARNVFYTSANMIALEPRRHNRVSR